MLRKTLLALVVLLLAFIVTGLFLPAEYRVARSISIDRPAATVFTVLNSYGAFNEWSPWAERDPEAVYATEGPQAPWTTSAEWARLRPMSIGGWDPASVPGIVPSRLIPTNRPVPHSKCSVPPRGLSPCSVHF